MDNSTNLGNRLRYFIEKQLFISIGEFEKKLEFSQGTIYRVINKGSNIGVDKIEVIAKKYPYLNMDWLIAGEGEMLEDLANVGEPSPKYKLDETSLEDGINNMTKINLTIAESNKDLVNNNAELVKNNSVLVGLVSKYIKILEGQKTIPSTN